MDLDGHKSRLSRSIGLVITNRCNAECDFCCNESGPTKAEGLSIDVMRSVVVEAHSLGFCQICLTGGEPFLRLKDIFRIGKLSNDLGLSMTINTNGFFGTNKRSTFNILQTLKHLGLVKINLSFDESHEKWVSLDAIKNVMSACRELEISIYLVCAYLSGGKKLSDYFLGADLEGVVVSESPVRFTGRAETIEACRFTQPSELPMDTCPDPFNMVINFDGNIYPCCSVSGFTKPILLGNITQTSLSAAIKAAVESKYLYYIQQRGLNEFFEKDTAARVLASQAHSVCDLCKVVCESETMHKRVLGFIDNEFTKYAQSTLHKIFAS